ncbi:single-stranded DNA-binding protein [Deinococcus yavapaiensis]|uniref:Uncharacterized protein n=1 Tax=Deinococcus yavapaiensis KR-236 TaxID=694435 RepID=A0A318S188_9DEIO|nr:single-stranded DNA-binding protein [Deinococcus yavapaiensis]PYE51085.1 hypothetical protein DES52_11517 [Deinococcus yavapaiensis KR-236]
MHSDLAAVRAALSGSASGRDVRFAMLEVRGDRALVTAILRPDAVFAALTERFDEQWDLGYDVVSVSPTVVRCRLAFLGRFRDGLGTGADIEAARLVALTDAVRSWEMTPEGFRAEPQWVEYDPEEGPNIDELGDDDSASQARAEPPESPRDPQMEKAKKHIDDLMDQLRDRGLGKQASVVIARHGGYGKDLEDSRRVYAELKALLKT